MILYIIFVIVPILEITLLIMGGQYIGALPVIGLIILTAAIGSFALRQQGLSTLRKLQTAHPHDLSIAMTDGILLLISGILLITPGFATDSFGFMLLVPSIRRYIARKARHYIERSTFHTKPVDDPYDDLWQKQTSSEQPSKHAQSDIEDAQILYDKPADKM